MQSGLSQVASPQSPATEGAVQQGAPAGLQDLLETLAEFTTTQIVLALLLSSGDGKDDDKECGGGALLGLMAGLAIGAQLGQLFQGAAAANGVQEASGMDSGSGLGLDVSV